MITEIPREPLLVDDMELHNGLTYLMEQRVGLRPQLAARVAVEGGYDSTAAWLMDNAALFAQAMVYGIQP